MTDASEPTYAIEATNTPDGDGHYCVTVLRYGETAKTFYSEDREGAIQRARTWIRFDRDFDATDIERIEVEP